MYQAIFKRVLDVLYTIIILPFLLISLIIIGPLIYLTDRGPVFYCAPRMGRRGKRFVMYKFRSMRVNAPDVRNPDGSTYSSENDERLTRIGTFIRKTSLDELPQLLNILSGDMSVVGPRPILYSDKYSAFEGHLKKRLNVKPGLTGYTQAYFRNSIDQEKKFEYDAWYVDNISFWLDTKIILDSFRLVAKRKNVFTSQK
jgi:undecaprenyl phosphate N,N'-diacetylbacillosamine 1-phosphate transferase